MRRMTRKSTFINAATPMEITMARPNMMNALTMAVFTMEEG